MEKTVEFIVPDSQSMLVVANAGFLCLTAHLELPYGLSAPKLLSSNGVTLTSYSCQLKEVWTFGPQMCSNVKI